MVSLLRRGGPLLASALVLAAAVASLFGPGPVQRLVGSTWFIAGAGILVLTSLLAAAVAIKRHSWPGTVQHVGLVVAFVGIAVNQKAAHSGYVFLEQGAGGNNFSLSRNLRSVDELSRPFALDSLTTVQAKAFQSAPVTWVPVDGRSFPVTYNRPLQVDGRQLLLTQIVAPGFLSEYEIAADASEYLLLHNQVTELPSGLRLSSFGYDADARRVGIEIGGEQLWLGIGESAQVQGRALKLLSATFAANMGALFVVNDTRYRFIVFIGFGLALLGLLPPLFRSKTL